MSVTVADFAELKLKGRRQLLLTMKREGVPLPAEPENGRVTNDRLRLLILEKRAKEGTK